jgi:ketosteroid isomerase-like protein
MKIYIVAGILMLFSSGVRASIGALIPPLFGAQAAGQSGNLTNEIIALRSRWIEAEEKKNIPFLAELIAEDCVIGNSQGQVLEKTKFLQTIGDPNRVFRETNMHNIRVRGYGDIAIMTEDVTIEGSDKGVPFGGEFRFIRIFHRESGTWHVVLAQGTPMMKK